MYTLSLKILISYFVSINSLDENNFKNALEDSSIVIWNNLSIQSLKRQKSLERNITLKKAFDYEIQRKMKVLGMSSGKDSTRSSIRLIFLNDVLCHESDQDYIIAEEEISGETLDLKNYIIKSAGFGKITISKWYYKEGKWQLIENVVIQDKDFSCLTINCFTKFGNGMNNSKIVLTYFKSHKPVKSEYYMQKTISAMCPLYLISGLH